ncbi:MAG: chorismate-binding protein, partial [Nitrospiraceae bacterium]
MIRPSRARFLIAERPEPLVLSLPLPGTDACELYRRIAVPGRPSFLLESGKGGEAIARYSFLGSDPYLVLSGKDDRYELRSQNGTTLKEGDPFTALATVLRASRIARPEGFPPFFGGAVGFISYDAARRFERLPSLALDDLALPDLQFAFVDLLAALDHHERTLHLIFAPPLDRLLGEPRQKLYREGCDRLAELEARLSVPSRVGRDLAPPGQSAIAPDQSRTDYMERVRQCQEYIRAGDIYQANLSHRFTIGLGNPSPQPSPSPVAFGPLHVKEAMGTPATGTRGEGLGQSLYSRLRRVNPSPFAALLEFEDVTLVSSSPERLVRLQGRRVDTRPIAGTRPRGLTQPEDRRLVEELL